MIKLLLTIIAAAAAIGGFRPSQTPNRRKVQSEPHVEFLDYEWH